CAQRLYKFTAWLTGIFLLLLVLQMIIKYGFGYEMFAAGTAEDGTEFIVGFYVREAVLDGVNISLLVLIVPGWLYVAYLLGCFRLWSMMRWGGMGLLAMAGGGVVPLMSFFGEGRVRHQTTADWAEQPGARVEY